MQDKIGVIHIQRNLGGWYKSNLCSPVFLNIYAQKSIFIYLHCANISFEMRHPITIFAQLEITVL